MPLIYGLVASDAMTDGRMRRDGILVLGAGELGMAVLRELARLREQGLVSPISVLLRPAGGDPGRRETIDAVRALGVGVIEADLVTSAVEDLAAVFAPFAQIVCCTGFVGGRGTQRRITQAVLRAQIDHYVPWQFGVDYDVVGRGSGQEVWDEQLDVRDMLRAQTRIRWTILSTGMFTSFVFLPAFGLADLGGRIVRALGSWDHRLTATTPEDVGRLTALVAADPGAFADRIVHVAGDTFTYRELADTVDRVLGAPVTRKLLTVDELHVASARDPGNTMASYRLAFARPNGVAWPIESTLNAERGMAMMDVATWLRRRRDFDGAPPKEDQAPALSDAAAVRIARPEELIASPDQACGGIAALAQRYYGWWNADSLALFAATVSPAYIDRTPPAGREPGAAGLAEAQRMFRNAFPDGRVHVLQQVVAGDRVVSHLRITGRFTGHRRGVRGHGQRIDYLATDIMRVADGKVIENWHVEDHEALHRQLA